MKEIKTQWQVTLGLGVMNWNTDVDVEGSEASACILRCNPTFWLSFLTYRCSILMENQSSVSEFFLRGISGFPEQQQLLYGLFLCMYLVTLTGNVLIILAIGSDPQLHTPMYFFVANLSFADMGLISSTVTKMLFNVQTQHHTISLSLIHISRCLRSYASRSRWAPYH